MPDVREIFDRAAPTYDAAVFPFFTPFGAALVEYAQIGPDERVLDVGCGAGAALAPASRIAASAVGIELSPAMAERAREAAPKAEVIVGDAASLDLPDDSFDVVLSAFVIFFMEDPTAVLREWGRVLKPDGRLVISTWAGGDPRWAFEREIRRPLLAQLPQDLVQDLVRANAMLERFAEPAKVQAELSAAGFDAEPTIEHQIKFVFPDEQAWWDWTRSHAGRMAVDALPDDAQRQLRAQMRDGMEAIRNEAGYPRAYTALFTRARTPSESSASR
jgi:ubiquinone/menaquinone biosynthesis C-methylase UbiE